MKQQAEIRAIDFAECIPHIGDLLQAHFAEMGFDFPFAISADMYRTLDNAGVLMAFAAYKNGQVIGYCTAMLAPHTFNPAILFALHDLLFVSLAHRKAGIGRQLMAAAENEAKKRGAHRFLWHTHAGTPLAGALERQGYKPIDVVVMKGL